MIPDIRISQNSVEKYLPDRFARQEIFKLAKIDSEFLVDGRWVRGKPEGRYTAKRTVIPVKGGVFADFFQSADTFQLVRATYLAWESMMDASISGPVAKEAIIQRLFEPQESRLVARISTAYGGRTGMRPYTTLFTPWGVRPEGQFGNSEQNVLDRISSLRDRLDELKIPSQVLLMPADVYATEVNRQVSQERADDYFSQVTEAGKQRGFIVEPWSQIRERSWIRYTKRAEELTPEAIRSILPASVIAEAQGAATRRSGFSSQSDIEEAMFRYLRERICEAEIIDSWYKPIKVSAVANLKDNGVDRNLPRIYIVPPELQFPWLK
jgi:hypothetical protein